MALRPASSFTVVRLALVALAVTACASCGGFLGPSASATTLTAVVTNSQNQTAGPFMASLPTPPSGWTTPYVYAGSTAAGTFVISASGDGTTVSLP